MHYGSDPQVTTLRSNHQCNKTRYEVKDAADDQHVAPIKPAQRRFAAPTFANKAGRLKLVHYKTWVKKNKVALTMAKSTP